MMDHQFPRQLFPSFYNSGPPQLVLRAGAAGWGSYGGVLAQGGNGSLSSWTFTPRGRAHGEIWSQTEPVPVPLLPPRKAFEGFVAPPDPLEFSTHMQNFFVDHSSDAFRCTSEILGENFYFKKARTKEKYRQGSVNVRKTKRYVDRLMYEMCPEMLRSRSLDRYCGLLWDVVPDVPAELLGALLHEELTEQSDRLRFSEAATGGALAFVPFSQSDGCLLYPGGLRTDRLHFHKVALERRSDRSSLVDASGSVAASFQLKAPVRQISCASLCGDCFVAVRSDHLCGVWRFSETSEPRLLQAVNSQAAATCVSVSPHILGEVLVANASGAASLWTVGRGMQRIRAEDANLYFNANSSWRWCEFSAHPRVMLYADRTGAELTDFRLKGRSSSGHTLFRISSSSDCQSGERLLLCRYLADVHPFHHLLTTQHSAYIMDERFPCVPVLKWDHMMQAPPLFCHVSSGGTAKVLLGSQSSQEICLLQYSGGRAEACCSRGSPQALLRPANSLRLLPVQIPHRRHVAADRLASPAAGLTCFRAGAGGGDSMCIFQLTEAGDVFYQTLEQRPANTERPGATGTSEPLMAYTSSSEVDVVAPTRAPDVCPVVPETTERSRSLDSTQEEMSVLGGVQSASQPDADQTPVALGGASLRTWRLWLQKLMRLSQDRRRCDLQRVTIDSGGLQASRGMQEDLRKDLKACMRRRSLLLSGVPELLPFPSAVNADAWTDALSERLTVAWRSEEEWRAWWHDRLGMNRDAKKEALRRRRRREKEARGSRLNLSGSFTSSVSYQTDLDDFSDSTGWSSATSQGSWLGGAGMLSKLGASMENRETSADPVVQSDSPSPVPTRTPQRHEAPPPSQPETPSANQRRRRLADDYLSSLCETQDEPSQTNFPSLRPAASSQLPSSQYSFPSLVSSQLPSSSRASQSSQPKKKKSRMGF